GSCKKNGARPISSPATLPRLQSTLAPSAVLYHSTAAGVSRTASMTERTVVELEGVIISLSSVAYKSTAAEFKLSTTGRKIQRITAEDAEYAEESRKEKAAN